MDDFPIIDPHHHLWDLEQHRYPWLQDEVKPAAFGDYTALRKSYLLEDFLADARNQNVVKSVHLDVGFDPADPAGETRWLQGLADRHGFPHGIASDLPTCQGRTSKACWPRIARRRTSVAFASR